MFVVYRDNFVTYFDIAELAEILALQDRSELAGKLRQIISNSNNLPVIAGRTYITEAGLAEAGIAVDIGWELSSHTPVSFISASH